MNPPTPFSEVNSIVEELLHSVQAVLGERLVGMYLDGSLANGGFDEDSDIDFVAVTTEEITGDLFLALQAMHDRIAGIDSRLAVELEGSYLSREAVRRYDPANDCHPNIERGRGERLKMLVLTESWNVHRYGLRERGIILVGPDPRTLVDPVTPEDLRRAMHPVLDWGEAFLQGPAPNLPRGYQSYIVLSMCRVLYTLEHGAVVSKQEAARWAQDTLVEEWAPLIERAWAGRHNPGGEVQPEDVAETLEFIRYTLARRPA